VCLLNHKRCRICASPVTPCYWFDDICHFMAWRFSTSFPAVGREGPTWTLPVRSMDWLSRNPFPAPPPPPCPADLLPFPLTLAEQLLVFLLTCSVVLGGTEARMWTLFTSRENSNGDSTLRSICNLCVREREIPCSVA
jgi:hypothetical protein